VDESIEDRSSPVLAPAPLRYRVGWRAEPVRASVKWLGRVRRRRRRPARAERYVQSQFVVAASEVLHEGVSGDDDGRCSVGA